MVLKEVQAALFEALTAGKNSLTSTDSVYLTQAGEVDKAIRHMREHTQYDVHLLTDVPCPSCRKEEAQASASESAIVDESTTTPTISVENTDIDNNNRVTVDGESWHRALFRASGSPSPSLRRRRSPDSSQSGSPSGGRARSFGAKSFNRFLSIVHHGRSGSEEGNQRSSS